MDPVEEEGNKKYKLCTQETLSKLHVGRCRGRDRDEEIHKQHFGYRTGEKVQRCEMFQSNSFPLHIRTYSDDKSEHEFLSLRVRVSRHWEKFLFNTAIILQLPDVRKRQFARRLVHVPSDQHCSCALHIHRLS